MTKSENLPDKYLGVSTNQDAPTFRVDNIYFNSMFDVVNYLKEKGFSAAEGQDYVRLLYSTKDK